MGKKEKTVFDFPKARNLLAATKRENGKRASALRLSSLRLLQKPKERGIEDRLLEPGNPLYKAEVVLTTVGSGTDPIHLVFAYSSESSL